MMMNDNDDDDDDDDDEWWVAGSKIVLQQAPMSARPTHTPNAEGVHDRLSHTIIKAEGKYSSRSN